MYVYRDRNAVCLQGIDFPGFTSIASNLSGKQAYTFRGAERACLDGVYIPIRAQSISIAGASKLTRGMNIDYRDLLLQLPYHVGFSAQMLYVRSVCDVTCVYRDDAHTTEIILSQ